MNTPDAIKTLWDTVFGSAGQGGLSQRMSAVERDTENTFRDRIMPLLLTSSPACYTSSSRSRLRENRVGGGNER